MKLNNRGWGYNSLVIFGTIFLIFLIIVSIGIKTMIKNNSNKDDANYVEVKNENYGSVYASYETLFKRAGETYALYHETLVNNSDDVIIVNEETLYNEGLIEKLDDPSGNGYCKGFALINIDGTVKGFIKCDNYQTDNYELWVD